MCSFYSLVNLYGILVWRSFVWDFTMDVIGMQMYEKRSALMIPRASTGHAIEHLAKSPESTAAKVARPSTTSAATMPAESYPHVFQRTSCTRK